MTFGYDQDAPRGQIKNKIIEMKKKKHLKIADFKKKKNLNKSI